MTSDPAAQSFILALDSPDATIERVGGKGASLARLASAGLPVPSGFHVTTHAYRCFVAENRLASAILSAAALAQPDDPATLDSASSRIIALFAQGLMPAGVAVLIRQAYQELGAGDPPVAVRSSATAEDLPGMSFAGQQDTYLNVGGAGALLEAVQRCWASLWTGRALAYRVRHGIRPEDVALAVVVQHLVPAEVAGILFTADPVTARRDRVVINAAWGLGEAVVGGLVTPDTYLVDKETGTIDSQTIGDKAVMTALVPEGTRAEAVQADKRQRATLQPRDVAELARLGVRIEELYGQPMDVEWACQAERFSILQARPITALPEPPAALQWRVPPAGRSYLRANVIELLPDPLSPLFATLALPVWGDAVRELVTSLGMPEMFPRPPLLTINGYAYYDFGLSPSGYARLLLHLPRVSRRLSRLLRRSGERWSEIARPRYAAAIAAWAGRDLSATRAADLLEAARQLTRAAAEHYLVIQTGIQRWGTVGEAAFTSLYNRLIKHASDPPALTFLLGLDSAPIRAEKSLFDMAAWARIHPELAGYLATASSAAIAAARLGPSAPIATAEIWREFCRRLAAHLDQFGHTVYDLDFAKAVPADDPTPLLQALKFFLTGRARSPYERQVADAAAREQATEALLSRLTGWRRALFRRLLAWAQRYGPLREDALADVGLGWPLLRRMLLEIGQRLVAAGALASARDVFWLVLHEVETATRALDASEPISDYRAAVAERQVAWERERLATPPVSLPLKGGVHFAGLDWRNWLAARSDQAAGTSIRGIGASPGRVAGIARVLQDPADFGQMQPGDILVAKITTPAWTPLFALAAAVATDVGGPLSHSSIVAREYHIPAVLGTGVATERIRSGQRITVDGDAGVVTIDA